ncbi:MAG: hypothetical protein ACI9FJ_002906 [Alteromonadaceae bacterium]|jgi:hypothetical protein
MAISSVAIASFEQVSQTRLNVNQQNSSEKAQQLVEGLGTAQERKTQLNTSILESHYSVSLSSKNDPMSTLFKRAIEGINKELEPTLGKNAAQNSFAQGIDFSPEATAKRIVDFATSFFPLYQQQQGGDGSLEDQLDSFLNAVGGGVDKGFGEAKDILTGLNVFNGDIEENANSTYDLIYEGFAKFKESVLGATEEAALTAE